MEQGPVQPQTRKIDQLKQNLKAWNSYYWLIFFGLIPLLLILIFALPPAVKNDYLIFHTSHLLQLQTYVLSGYTHSELFPHLIGNLALYLIAMGAVFAFETNRQRFHAMAAVSFLVVPVICAGLTAGLWHFFGGNTSMQGFSGITAAILAYAFMAGVTWLLGGGLELFDHRASFPGPVWRYYVAYVLLVVVVVLIVLLGILEGEFMPAGNAISNGIAHFGGFISGLVSFVIIDLMVEKRKNFDAMIIISIIVGTIFYAEYLALMVKMVRGL